MYILNWDCILFGYNTYNSHFMYLWMKDQAASEIAKLQFNIKYDQVLPICSIFSFSYVFGFSYYIRSTYLFNISFTALHILVLFSWHLNPLWQKWNKKNNKNRAGKLCCQTLNTTYLMPSFAYKKLLFVFYLQRMPTYSKEYQIICRHVRAVYYSHIAEVFVIKNTSSDDNWIKNYVHHHMKQNSRAAHLNQSEP